jgi:cytochrome c-type biogenesis protein CcmH/NrfG
LFRRASREYLNGNWIKAEQLLTHLIRLNARDVDAQLMLASLLRRTGQLTEAAGRLRRLEATDGFEKWRSEIARERQMLEGQFTKHQNVKVENDVTETPEAKAA